MEENMLYLYLYDFLKIITACFLGGIIGQQRSKKGMSMGIRTHIVVCVSAALVQIISIDYNLINNANLDVMRLGAQVISGIGFLGMASIIREGRIVVGLTTAASIWFIACVGLAVGSGLYIPAIMATFVIYFILNDVLNLDKRNERKMGNNNLYELEITLNEIKDSNNEMDIIFNTITGKGYETFDIHVNAKDRSNVIIFINISAVPNRSPNEIISELLKYKFIKKVSIISTEKHANFKP
jgi:putative Mg2+ transporter-C (MgtC) family protein